MELEVITDDLGEKLADASAFPAGTRVVGISPKWEPQRGALRRRVAVLRGVVDGSGVSVGISHYPAGDFFVLAVDDS